MDRLRPWPGRGVKAELSNSQLWMSRLGRETWRAASGLAGALISPCTFPQWGLDQQGCFRQVFGYPHVPSACCVPHTNHTAMQAPCTHCVTASQRGQDYSCFLFTEEETETHRRGAFAQSHTLRIRAYKSHESEWDLSTGRGHTLWVCTSFPLPSPPLIHSGVCAWGEWGSDSGNAKGSWSKDAKKAEAANQDDTLLWAINGKRMAKFHFICLAMSRCSINAC